MDDDRFGQARNQGIAVVDVFIVLIVVAVVGAAVLPGLLRARRYGGGPTCEPNLKQIGNCVKMYLSDWDDHYPTNRQLRPNGTPRGVCVSVSLSRLRQPDETDPPWSQYGPNWVEALYNYADNGREDPQSAWRCPQATGGVYPAGSKRAGVSYVFNRSLIEKYEGIVKNASNLMLVRESDRGLNSELRPLNDATGTSKTPPISPFLCAQDQRIGRTQSNFHSNGSFILFADGHVKVFSSTFFPSKITRQESWDPSTKQWYNRYYAKPETPEQRALCMSIAITP